MFQTIIVEKIKTHILRSTIFFRKRAVFLCYVEKCSRAGQATGDNIIRRMRIACYRHSEYVILTAFPWQQSLTRTHLST